IKNVQIVLDELYGLVEAYAPEVAAAVWAQWEEHGYVEAVNETIAKLNTVLSERYAYYVETALPAIEASIGAMTEQKDALAAELATLKTELEVKKAELEAVIAEQEIGSIYNPNINIDAELGNNEQTVVPETDCEVEGEGIAAELKAAIADLEDAIAVIEALIADIEADIADMIVLAEQIAAAVAELEKTMTSIVEAGADLATAIEEVAAVLQNSDGVADAVVSSYNAARESALAAAEVLELTLGTANDMMEDINEMLVIIVEDAEALYNKFVTDLPACIEQIPEEAIILAAPIALIQQALEANKEEINAALEAEIAALAAEYDIDVAEVQAQIEQYTKDYELDEAAINAELEAIEAKIAEEVEAKYAAIDAETQAQIAALKAEAEGKLAALQAELDGYKAELEAAAEADKAAIQTQIDRVTGDMNTVKEELECAIAHLEEAAQVSYEEIKAEVSAAYEAAIAELNEKLAELKAVYEAALAELNDKKAALKAAYDKAVEELKAAADKAIAELIAEAEKQIAELGKVGEELNKAVNGIYAAIREEVKAAQAAMEEILKGELEAVEDLVEAVTAMTIESAEEVVKGLIEQVEALLKEATSDDLVLGETGYYVALGDGSAVSDSYVDKVAAQLEAENEVELDFTNYADAEHTIGDAYAIIEANAADIANADLITVGYGNAAFADAAINQMYNALMNGNAVSYDWAALVGAEGAEVVAEILDEIYEELVANGLDISASGMKASVATAMKLAIESYAYGAVEYVVNLPGIISELREVNEDAVIVIVGMYNPLQGVTLTYEGLSIEVGEYLEYLVEGANAYGIGYCMVSGDAIYVAAPKAETAVQNQQFDILPFMMQYFMGQIDLNPTEAGHEYIKVEILEALNVLEEQPEVPEEPEDPEEPAGAAVRYSGETRYQTSLKIAEALKALKGVDKFEAVVLASGAKFPDALAGSYLANQKDAPILLTDEKSAAEVNAYINSNLAANGTVYVLGGEAAVSAKALKGINTKNIERLYGDTRIETNLKILEEAGIHGNEILVCTSEAYADALSASAVNKPILLVGKTFSGEQIEFLDGLNNVKFTIVGGSAAVSGVIEKTLKAYGEVERLSGATRYETSVLLAEKYVKNPEAVVLAYGQDFPDGLCGGPLAYNMGAAVVLADAKGVSAAAAYAAGINVEEGVVLGGSARIGDKTVREIFGLDAEDEIVVK
ncbi:MAG: cell wall-binding repeat-containing protein, partial [Oscillospiraceae bacterium]|nr:cell wall-binding repeat-containing protein [Oscillospiraceae bacterium]